MYLTIKIINVKIIEKWVFLVFFKKIKSVFLCTPKGLKYIRVCRKYRFTNADIEEFINRQKQQKEQFEFVDTRTDYQKRMNKKLRVV